MTRRRKPSAQSIKVLAAFAAQGETWLYGLEIARQTGLESGSLYPILIRLSEHGLLESQWLQPQLPGRPPRHAYRILPAGRALLDEMPQGAPAAFQKVCTA